MNTHAKTFGSASGEPSGPMPQQMCEKLWTLPTAPTRRRIWLFGNFGTGNLGNECTLLTMICNIRRYVQNADIRCICSRPEDTSSRYNIPAYPIKEMPSKVRLRQNTGALGLLKRIFIGIPWELHRWFKTIRTLKGSDMLVMTGTGMLGDFGILPLGLHYDILRWSIIAKLCRCKLFFVSVGVGPIRHPLSRFFIKAALALADYRSYRDCSSMEYLKGIGFARNSDTVYPDLVFSLPRDLIPAIHDGDGQTAVIGVGLMTYFNDRATSETDETIYNNYIAKIASFVTWLVEHKYTVRLLIGDATFDNRVREDLIRLLKQSGLNFEDGNIIDDPASSTEEVLSQLAATDLVVASRFHNVLMALMLNKPVVAISYHEKIDSLMAGVGLAEFCQGIEQVDVDKLIGQFTKLEENAELIRPQIERNTEAFRTLLDKQYARIFSSP